MGTDRAFAVGQWKTDHVVAVGTSRATRALGGYAEITEQQVQLTDLAKLTCLYVSILQRMLRMFSGFLFASPRPNEITTASKNGAGTCIRKLVLYYDRMLGQTAQDQTATSLFLSECFPLSGGRVQRFQSVSAVCKLLILCLLIPSAGKESSAVLFHRQTFTDSRPGLTASRAVCHIGQPTRHVLSG